MGFAVIADSAPGAGLGHLGRSSAIAAALRARGEAVHAFAYGASGPLTLDGVEWLPLGDPPEAQAIVLDTYTMPVEQQALLAASAPLAFVDDLGDAPPGAALVLRIAGGDGPSVLAGLRHAPLRAPFWGLPEREVHRRVERVLVTTGGALPDAAVELARAVREALPSTAVAVVRGPHSRFEAPPGVQLVDAPPSLLDELLAADVVVTAAGQTSLEAAATGAPTVTLAFVDNQRGNAAALAEAGAAVVVRPDDVAAAVQALAANHAHRVALARAAQLAVDGFGALRIAFRLARL